MTRLWDRASNQNGYYIIHDHHVLATLTDEKYVPIVQHAPELRSSLTELADLLEEYIRLELEKTIENPPGIAELQRAREVLEAAKEPDSE